MPLSDEMFRRKLIPSGRAVADPPEFGLTFKGNNVAASDVRIVWSGGNLLSRTSHTAIWRVNYFQQTGYYAVAWHSHNNGSFAGDTYEYGTHPYPSAAGAVDGQGRVTDGTGAAGTIHYFEMAGLGANDFLCSPGGTAVQVVKSQWYVQARTCEVIGGTTLRHTYYPDVLGNPDFKIEQDILLSNLAAAGASPAFYIGASDWRSGSGGAGATSTDESPGGTLRGLMLFDAPLSLQDITDEALNDSTNAAVTTAGIAAVWYCNKNPTPSDVADKQSQRTAHSPSWATASRPDLATL